MNSYWNITLFSFFFKVPRVSSNSLTFKIFEIAKKAEQDYYSGE